MPLGKRIPLENIGCQRSAATVVPPVFRESRTYGVRTQFANRKTEKHMTSASRKTPRCIYYDCHAPGHQVITGQFLPFRVGFWWNRNDATTFLRFRRPRFPRRDPGFSFSTVFAEILRRFALGFFSSFFLLLLEFQSWQFYYFSPLFCREDSSIFQENASRSSLSLKFYFSSEKGLPSQFFFFEHLSLLASNLL